MNNDIAHLLLGKGKDLRTISGNHEVIATVSNQETFDKLFVLLFHHERALAMRAADAVEKITRKRNEFLEPHKPQLLRLLKGSMNIELKWHIAQLMSRVMLTANELDDVWHILSYWSQNPNESKIVRVNALQALFELSRKFPDLKMDFEHVLHILEHIPIPSIQARVRKLKKIM
jgi:hypothetical protein